MEKHDPDAIYPNTIKYTDKETIYCDNDHPRVYYNVPKEGYVVCGYCDIKFMNKENVKSEMIKGILKNEVIWYVSKTRRWKNWEW